MNGLEVKGLERQPADPEHADNDSNVRTWPRRLFLSRVRLLNMLRNAHLSFRSGSPQFYLFNDGFNPACTSGGGARICL